MKLFFALLMLLVSVSAVFSQKSLAHLEKEGDLTNPSAYEIAASGEVKNGKYVNSRLGLTISLPSGWTVVLSEASRRILDLGENLISKDKSDEVRKAINKSVNNSEILVQAVSSNPKENEYRVLALGVERIPSSVNLEAYLDSARKLILQSPTTYSVYDPVKMKLGEKEWVSFDVTSKSYGVTMKQTYMMTHSPGTVVFCILTAIEGNDPKPLKDSAATMRFHKKS